MTQIGIAKKKTRMVCESSPLAYNNPLNRGVAEDFYGNDYPEDEVNSDDEFDKGAYNYRYGASDDEEFGEEEPNWSDEENEAKRPWTFDRQHTETGMAK